MVVIAIVAVMIKQVFIGIVMDNEQNIVERNIINYLFMKTNPQFLNRKPKECKLYIEL